MGAKLSGGGGGSKLHVDQNAEINVTPFVDVMLVLLIIFMVAAPLATVSVEVVLPKAVAKPQPSPPKPVYISVTRDGSVFIGDFPTSLDTLGDDMKKAIGARDPDQERIYIRCDQKTRYAEFMKVMNKLQDNGYYSVALVGEDDTQ
ncbi:biopolymer transport protein exbD [Asticcacaulis biprosthecium C19]|uniref:Biopolymer transport protein exbD n=1 Tax=Asticcacaulis biprosthecium C19 TaxID=715226 RepID=F4QS00_9CAUL|nr:biopolymer transporter ExbD [Asticcacaulis biprosthecium]EGF89520.1 biopolymer transport protein exbD [Asticcacaulis biprosthecium C19]